MIHNRLFTGVAALAVAACMPSASQKARVAEKPVTPRAEMAKAFEPCTWGEVSGAGLVLYSYACGPERSSKRLVVDESLPGFAVESTDQGGHPTRETVIQMFFRSADDPVDAIATSIGAVSPALEGDSCALVPAGALNPRPEDGRLRYIWAPTGEMKTRWEASKEEGQAMPPPCGPLGVQHSGAITFEILEDDPTKVIAVTWNKEAQIFDPSTIRSTEPAAR